MYVEDYKKEHTEDTEEEMKESRLTSVGASEGSDSSIILSKKRELQILTKPELRPNPNSVAIFNRKLISGDYRENLEVPRMLHLRSTHMVGESNSASKIFKSKVGAISDASGSIGMPPKPSLMQRDSGPNNSKISGSGTSKFDKHESTSNKSNSSGSEFPGLIGIKMSGEQVAEERLVNLQTIQRIDIGSKKLSKVNLFSNKSVMTRAMTTEELDVKAKASFKLVKKMEKQISLNYQRTFTQ